MPTLFVIAGCNGAGKTTLSKNLLPDYLGVKEFVNADEIARGLSPFNPEGVAFAAGRIMLERIRGLAADKTDFAIETTLATKVYAPLFKELRQKKYEIVLLFVYLSSTKEAIRRVKKRVSMGGHNIPKEVVERRFKRGLKYFNTIYLQLADRVIVVDNTFADPVFVAEKKKKELIIFETEVWNNIQQYE